MFHVVPALFLLMLQSYPASARSLAFERLILEQAVFAGARQEANASPDPTGPDATPQKVLPAIRLALIATLWTNQSPSEQQDLTLEACGLSAPVVSSTQAIPWCQVAPRITPSRAGPNA